MSEENHMRVLSWQSQRIRESPRGQSSSNRPVGGAEAKSWAYISIYKQETESALKTSSLLKSQKPATTDILPPTRPHIQTSPWDQVVKCPRLLGDISFNYHRSISVGLHKLNELTRKEKDNLKLDTNTLKDKRECKKAIGTESRRWWTEKLENDLSKSGALESCWGFFGVHVKGTCVCIHTYLRLLSAYFLS